MSSAKGGADANTKTTKTMQQAIGQFRAEVEFEVENSVLQPDIAQDLQLRFPTRADVLKGLQAFAEGGGTVEQAVERITKFEFDPAMPSDSFEAKILDKYNPTEWVERIFADPNGAELPEVFAVVNQGNLLMYSAKAPESVYVVPNGMDVLRCSDPLRVLLESVEDGGLQALLDCKRYDGQPFKDMEVPKLPEDAMRTGGGWKKDKDGNKVGVEFEREDYTVPVEINLQRYGWDGEPDGRIATVGFRSRSLLKNPLVGGDTPMTDGCALHETLTVCFANEVSYHVVDTKEEEKTTVRSVHLLGFNFGAKKYSPVAGEELLMALKVSKHDFYIKTQQGLNVQMLQNEVDAAMKDEQELSDGQKEEIQMRVARSHDKLIVMGAMRSWTAQNQAAMREHGDSCFEEYRSQSVNIACIRASALCATQNMSERLLAAVVDGLWTPANGGKILTRQMRNTVLFFNGGCPDMVFDAIAHGFVPTPDDPNSTDKKMPVSYIPFGIQANEELMKRKETVTDALNSALQVQGVGRQLKFTSKLEQDRAVYNTMLQIGRMTLGDAATNELMKKCGSGNDGIAGMSRSIQTSFLLMAIQKWIACQVFKEQTGQEVENKEMMKEVLAVMKLTESEGDGENKESVLTNDSKEEANKWAADIAAKMEQNN